jgi:hypothetical protein
MSTKSFERRFTARGPIRVEKREDGQQTIAGYAAVFYRPGDAGTEYQVYEDFVEHIMPGAFDQILRGDRDTVGLFNHDGSQILGRRSAKTLRLSADAIGLYYEIDAPDRQDAKDLIVSLERGDIAGSSFSFWIGTSGKVVWIEEGEKTIRELHQFEEVPDVGPVTFPAYTGTTAGLRAIGEPDGVRQELAAWRGLRCAEQGEAMAMQLRIAKAHLRLDQLQV